MRIWIIDEEWADYTYEIETLTERFPGIEIKTSTYEYAEDLESFGQYADGILAQVYAPLPRAVLERLVNCKGIAVYGGGYDRVDTQACHDLGIGLTNIQGYCAEDVADFVVAAIYFGYKKISLYASDVKALVAKDCWGAQAVTQIGPRLSSQSLLIIGLGTIGSVVARKAQAMGLHVMAYDEYKTADEIRALGVEPVSWTEGFARADYISVNLRGVAGNYDKIGYAEFTLMKPTAWFINTARGAIVREAEFLQAAAEGQFAGAILDVIQNEPPMADNSILQWPRIWVTPHVSYISQESYGLLKEYAVDNLTAMLHGKEPRDPVIRRTR